MLKGRLSLWHGLLTIGINTSPVATRCRALA
jgi:hypothetical protein